MSWLAGPYLVACALLALAGGQKVGRPGPTGVALREAGLPTRDSAVRALGAAEVAAAMIGGLVGGVGAVPVALFYVGFTAFVAWALRRRTPLRSCGCLAANDDVPPTPVHLALDALFAMVAAAVAFAGVDVIDVLRAQPAAGVPFVLLAGVTTYLAYVVLAILPAVRPVRAAHATRPAA
jgi:hypothetical protein